MELFWGIIFWAIPIWVFVLIPFSTFFYEADDGMLMAGTNYAPNAVPKSRALQALGYQMFVFVIVGLVFIVTYFVLNETSIPVRHYEGQRLLNGYSMGVTPKLNGTVNGTAVYLPFDASQLQNMDERDIAYMSGVTNEGTVDLILEVDVSNFYAGLMAFIGWFLFAIFGGVGLAAMPLDLVLMYIKRPRHMDAVEFAEAQTSLRERVNELVDIGELIKIEREEKDQLGLASTWGSALFDSEKRKEARDERQAILGFKQAVFLLEKDVDDFQACHANYEDYNPLIPYIALVCGSLSFIISLMWFLHIVIYVLPDPPARPFLNNFFSWFDSWFPLFGVLSVAIFTVYLLLCAIKGCFKIGMRFLCMTLHPMKPGKTYMSSFMFNTGLVLLCALPVVQFCSTAFADYARFATIRQIYGVQIEYLKFFSFFWTNNVFIFAILFIMLLTSIYLACKPADQATNSQALRDRLKSRRG
jgi:LMBR1 domain-containing protein 1